MKQKQMNITIEEDIREREVKPENSLKQMFVDYVGEKQCPEGGMVTVDMVVKTLSEEFPEFVLAMAEQNFLQGYKQAFKDMEKWNKKNNNQSSEIKSVDVFDTPEE